MTPLEVTVMREQISQALVLAEQEKKVADGKVFILGHLLSMASDNPEAVKEAFDSYMYGLGGA